MDSFTDIGRVWNEWGATIATILAVIALLKSTGKEIKQMGSTVWHWEGWALMARTYRKANTIYRVHRAKSVMRQTLEEMSLRIDIRVYDNCLHDDPTKSVRGQLKEIIPAKPSWLNDYYVATALESLSNQGKTLKVRRYAVKSWPPNPEAYYFAAVNADKSANEETIRIETNDKCTAYQFFSYCPRASRFERQDFAETISARETRLGTTFSLKESASPCELCWEKEHRERDIRTLVNNITKYDLAQVATSEITGANRELQEVVTETCIESRCEAEANLIRQVVKRAIDIRQRQLAQSTPRVQYVWQEGEKQELVAALKEYIEIQTAQ